LYKRYVSSIVYRRCSVFWQPAASLSPDWMTIEALWEIFLFQKTGYVNNKSGNMFSRLV
jgi:hypothetical protein